MILFTDDPGLGVALGLSLGGTIVIFSTFLCILFCCLHRYGCIDMRRVAAYYCTCGKCDYYNF